MASSVVIIGLPEAMAKVAAIPAVAEISGEAALEVGKARDDGASGGLPLGAFVGGRNRLG